MKKLFSMFLVVIVIVLSSAPGSAQAATVKISKAKATLEVEATLQLKITGSESVAKWTSSKESVASVSKNGLVTAVKAGTAIITATVDSKDYLCTAYVVNSKNVSIAVGETIEFTNGEYIVGEDIPAGTYILTAKFGSAEILIYNAEEDFIEKEYSYIKYMALATEDSDAMEYWAESYSTEYKNLRLKNGYYIIIKSGLTVDVKRTK